MKHSITYRHSGSLGDIIYSLPAVLSQHKPANFLLWHSVPGNFYPGAKHPSGDYRMSRTAAEWLLPLLQAQPIIEHADICKHDIPIDIDLDVFRHVGITFLWGHLPRFYFYAIKGWYDLSTPWLFNVPKIPDLADSIIINRSWRYHNQKIEWNSVSDLPGPLVFVGTQDEYDDFAKQVPRASFCPCKSGLDMASVIRSGRMFIGNQSLSFAIAEALKVPRVLETCPWSANVVPTGGRCYDTFTQQGFYYACKDCYDSTTPLG